MLINMKSVVLWCFAVFSLTHAAFKLEERYSWNQLDFVFPTRAMKDIALASGTYIPQNALPVGVEHWGNKLFVTVPRWRDGIPATLTYIDTQQTISGSPQLIPYPDWRSNAVGDCANGLNTVYRIKADKCGRLWVLDTGTIGIGNTTQNVCPYSVNVFDLATNTRIRRYEFRAEDTNPNTFIANTAIDIGQNCEDTFTYFSDELGYGLIVYSWQQNRSWRFEHSFFYPDPLRGDFNIGGLNFQWGEEGIFGMALSPTRSDGFRTLYFSPLASHREFSVSTRILRDESRTEDSYHDFFFFPAERGSNAHTTARVCSDDGVMLFNLVDQNAVGCWHTSMPYDPAFHGVVDRDDNGLVFPADVKIDENRNVWVLSDRMPIFLMANLDYTDVNFRIYSAPLQRLIGGTVCDISNQISSRYGLNSILSANKPNGASIFTNALGLGQGLGQGLGAFKTINSPPLTAATQTLQNYQALSTQPLNARALQVPLQPISQLSQLSPVPQLTQLTQLSQLTPNSQFSQLTPISQISQISPIAKISQVQPVQPLISYDVREPISQQTYNSKPLTPIFPTKNTPQGTYFKGNGYATANNGYGVPTQTMTGYQPASNNLPVAYLNALLYNLFYLRKPSFGSGCQTSYANPALQQQCQTVPFPIAQNDLYYPNGINNNNNNNFTPLPGITPGYYYPS